MDWNRLMTSKSQWHGKWKKDIYLNSDCDFWYCKVTSNVRNALERPDHWLRGFWLLDETYSLRCWNNYNNGSLWSDKVKKETVQSHNNPNPADLMVHARTAFDDVITQIDTASLTGVACLGLFATTFWRIRPWIFRDLLGCKLWNSPDSFYLKVNSMKIS